MTDVDSDTVTIVLALLTMITTIVTATIAAIVAIMTSKTRDEVKATKEIVNGQTARLVEASVSAAVRAAKHDKETHDQLTKVE